MSMHTAEKSYIQVKNAMSGRLIVSVFTCECVMGLTGFRNALNQKRKHMRGPDYAGVVCTEEAMYITSTL